jgi:hypothetical protein
VVRRRRRFNRTEDLDVKVSKEALSSAIRSGWCSKGPATDHDRPQGQERRSWLEAIARHCHAAITRGGNDCRHDAGDWLEQHSVRGFLAGVVRKRLKLKLGSNKVDGTRVYRVATEDSGKPGARRSKRQSS